MVRKRADAATRAHCTCVCMPSSKQPTPPEKTLDELLDRVSNAREELTAIERTLERLRTDIAKSQPQKKTPAKLGSMVVGVLDHSAPISLGL
jgi:hypothetical protein